MNKRLRTAFVVAINLLSALGCAFAQDNDSLKTKYISAQEAQEEFRLVHDLINTFHPDPFKYTAAPALESSKNEFLAEITDSISESEMHIILRRYLRQVRCGHTVAQPSAQWYAIQVKHAKFLPLRVLMHHEKIYVDTCIGALPPMERGSEIISINGISANKILADMRAMQPQDGKADKFADYNIEKSFTTYFAFLYGCTNEYEITFKLNDETAYIQTLPGLKAGSTKSGQVGPVSSFFPKADTVVTMDGAVFTHLPDQPEVFYLDIETFATSGYRKFYRKVFDRLADQHNASLIIDIRDNGGGYFPNTNKLLQYISDSTFYFTFHRPRTKPEKNPHIKMGFFSRLTRSGFSLLHDPYKVDSVRTYRISYKPKRNKNFTGPVYLLTNGGSFSMSGYLAANLKHSERAIIIGQETGGGASGSNGILANQVVLPYSGIRINLPYYHLEHELKDESGVRPDHLISYSLEERLQGRDKEFQKFLELKAAGDLRYLR